MYPSEWLSWQSLRLRRIGLTATESLVIKTNPCTSHCSKSLPYGWKCWIPRAKTLPCYSLICQSKIRNCGGSGGHSPTLAAILLIFILTLSHFQLSKLASERLLFSITFSISLTVAWESVWFLLHCSIWYCNFEMHWVCGLQVGGHLKRQLCISCHSEKSQVQVSLTSQHALHMWMNASLVWRAVWVKPPLFFPLHILAHKVQSTLPGNFREIQYSENFSPQEKSLKF